MARYKDMKPVNVDVLAAEQVAPIMPVPVFRSNTSHVRVVQGGFMDDRQVWYPAPKSPKLAGGVKDAIRVNGMWYWAVHIRDRKGRMILSRALLFPMLQDIA